MCSLSADTTPRFIRQNEKPPPKREPCKEVRKGNAKHFPIIITHEWRVNNMADAIQNNSEPMQEEIDVRTDIEAGSELF